MKTSPTSPRYATIGERFLAHIVDSFAVLLIANLLLSFAAPESPLRLFGGLLVGMVYYTYFQASRWQATLGKRLLSIYVARSDGRWLNLRDALCRYLAFMMPLLPAYSNSLSQQSMLMLISLLAIVWFIPLLHRPDRAGIHDQLCDTRVLQGKLPSATP